MRGFTLLEVLLYLALYAICMQGVFTAVYAISESTERNQTKAYLAQEELFLRQKINLAAEDGIFLVCNPDTVLLTSRTGTRAQITFRESNIFISRNGEPAAPLSGVQVTHASFLDISSSSVKYTFTLEIETSRGQPVSLLVTDSITLPL